jgi:hypothetical protein
VTVPLAAAARDLMPLVRGVSLAQEKVLATLAPA